MKLAELTTAHGQRLELERLAREKLVTLAARYGVEIGMVRFWKFMARLEPEGLDWYERRLNTGEGREVIELHIGDSLVVWAERGTSWRVMGEREVRRLLFQGM